MDHPGKEVVNFFTAAKMADVETWLSAYFAKHQKPPFTKPAVHHGSQNSRNQWGDGASQVSSQSWHRGRCPARHMLYNATKIGPGDRL